MTERQKKWIKAARMYFTLGRGADVVCISDIHYRIYSKKENDYQECIISFSPGKEYAINQNHLKKALDINSDYFMIIAIDTPVTHEELVAFNPKDLASWLKSERKFRKFKDGKEDLLEISYQNACNNSEFMVTLR